MLLFSVFFFKYTKGQDSLCPPHITPVFFTPFPVNNVNENKQFREQDTLCVGDTIKYWVVDSLCPVYVGRISWLMEGNDGPDTMRRVASVTVTYSDTGTFIKAIYHDADKLGDSSAAIIFNGVTVLPCPPIAGFEADKRQVCAGRYMQFNDKSRRRPNEWHWYFEGGVPAYFSGQQPPPVYYATPGKYKVQLAVKSRFGADSIAYADYVEVLPAPQYIFVDTAFTVIYPNEATLTACVQTDTYRWFSGSFSCDTCAITSVKTSQAVQTFTCIAASASGCADTCLYTVLTNGIQGNMFIPNLFSPNQDGSNDIFKPEGVNIRLVSFKIFNRWGEKVFETDNLNIGWDGIFKGEPQPAGVYAYQITYFLGKEANAKLQKGTFTLVR